MAESNVKKWNYFVGVDTSKDELDFAVLRDNTFLAHKECKNTAQEIAALLVEFKTFKGFTKGKTLFCIEDTGMYCNPLLTQLKKNKANIVLETPLRIKRSLGLVRNKNDRIDAIRIAQYASRYRENLRLLSAKRPVIETLRELHSMRCKMQTIQGGIAQRLGERTEFGKKTIYEQCKKLCSGTLDAMKADIREIDREIDRLAANDENIRQLMEIITSVPYIGRVTAMHMIVCTNEFKDITEPRKFACFAGIAPFKIESGKMEGRAKVSFIANRKMKALLHICAMGAVKNDGEFRQYYERKLTEGKPKMLVLNAIRNKLVLRIFACVKYNRNYLPEYEQPSRS